MPNEMLNSTLTRADFYKKLSDSERAGFKKYRVETLPAGTLLFKLTSGVASSKSIELPKEPGEEKAKKVNRVTAWWAVVRPFKEDQKGVLGRWTTASAQGMNLSQITRLMGAVCIDWNDLDNYVEVELLQDTKVFWGTHAPMPKWGAAEWLPNKTKGWEGGIKGFQKRQALEKKVGGGVRLPQVLEMGEAWQMYIPDLEEKHLRRSQVIPGHDMARLGMAFGIISPI